MSALRAATSGSTTASVPFFSPIGAHNPVGAPNLSIRELSIRAGAAASTILLRCNSRAGAGKLQHAAQAAWSLGVNRITLAVSRSLPVYTQLRTCRRAAVADARCPNRKAAYRYLASMAHATKALIDAIFGWLARCTM
jgi:hypothetical protein